MTKKSSSNNERLRSLITASGLTQAAALDLFNRELGARPYSASAWKSFFCDPGTTRFRPFGDAMLELAEKVFGDN